MCRLMVLLWETANSMQNLCIQTLIGNVYMSHFRQSSPLCLHLFYDREFAWCVSVGLFIMNK